MFYQISSRKDKIASNAGLIMGFQKNVTYHCKLENGRNNLLVDNRFYCHNDEGVLKR